MNRTEELRATHPARSAREVIVGHVGSDPYMAIEELCKVGDAKAAAAGVAYELEHKRKSLLASLASEYARAHASENMSEARLDRLARADARYTAHIEATASAIEQRERLWSHWVAIRSELLWDEKAISHLNALTRLDDPR